ncbi:MAG: sigma-70 family RNA polymerase sigma factor [Verrucomicrobiota bacterium]
MNEGSTRTDVELLQHIAGGDTAALGSLYDRHSATLFALACRILNDSKEAEDVLQDVFVQLWERAADFDPDQGRVLGWALTLTRNRAIDRLRATHRRRARLVEDTEGEAIQDYPAQTVSAPEAVCAGEQGHLVRSALAALPPPERRAIELAFFDGLSQTEVASALNEPLGTIKARIRRGMQKLRRQLASHL